MVLHGSSIRVFVDDDEVVSSTSSFNDTATAHGLFCDDQSDHTWDDFGGWVSLFYGTIDSIRPRPRPGAQYCYVRALDEMERLTGVTLFTHSFATLPQESDEILGRHPDLRRRGLRSPSARPGKGLGALILDVRHLECPGDG